MKSGCHKSGGDLKKKYLASPNPPAPLHSGKSFAPSEPFHLYPPESAVTAIRTFKRKSR